jgi:hypothetical protein
MIAVRDRRCAFGVEACGRSSMVGTTSHSAHGGGETSTWPGLESSISRWNRRWRSVPRIGTGDALSVATARRRVGPGDWQRATRRSPCCLIHSGLCRAFWAFIRVCGTSSSRSSATSSAASSAADEPPPPTLLGIPANHNIRPARGDPAPGWAARAIQQSRLDSANQPAMKCSHSWMFHLMALLRMVPYTTYQRQKTRCVWFFLLPGNHIDLRAERWVNCGPCLWYLIGG